MPKLIIDGLEIEVPNGTKVIDAAERLGIMIPRFCYHEALGSVGACRMCAVKFVQGPFKGVQMSCMIDAQDGMVVSTTDEEAVEFRKVVIEWLMLNHPHDCPVCDEGGQCLLQDMTVSGGHSVRRYLGKKRTYKDQYLGPLIQHEMNRCIHCYRCSRFYQEYAGYRDLGVMQIASRVYFGRYTDGRLESPFSGNLVDICPTGVYTDKPARFKARRWDLSRSPSICTHCSLGCNTVANARNRAIARVEARVNKAVNGHFICDLGRFGFPYADHPGRPRRARIDMREASREEAVRTAARKLHAVMYEQSTGGFAALGSMRASLEAQAALRRFCRLLSCPPPTFFVNPSIQKKVRRAVSRLRPDVAVSMGELENADFIVTVGTDPINEAPMLALAMRQARRKGADVVVIDPRPVCLPFEFEHLPVAIDKMEACLSLLTGSAAEAYKENAEEADPYGHAPIDTIPADGELGRELSDRILALGLKLNHSKRPVIVCGTDIVRETTPDLAADHAQLLRATQGDSGLFYVFPGANAFGAELCAGEDDRSFMDILIGIESGAITALLVVESDPFYLFPDQQRLEIAFTKLNLLIVLDYLPSGMACRANIFLPTLNPFETGSTFINQEGRIQFSKPVHPGGIPICQETGGGHPPREYGRRIPGRDQKAAWETLLDLAEAMSLPTETTPGNREDAELRPESIPSRLDTGQLINEERLERSGTGPGEMVNSGERPESGARTSEIGPWTWIAEEIPVFRELGMREYPVDGVRALCPAARPEGQAAITAPSEPTLPKGHLQLILVGWTFGTDELSNYSHIIQQVEKEPYVCMHPDDAARVNLSDGDNVLIPLERGSVELPLKLTNQMARGILILPRHRQIPWQRLGTFAPTVDPALIKKS